MNNKVIDLNFAKKLRESILSNEKDNSNINIQKEIFSKNIQQCPQDRENTKKRKKRKRICFLTYGGCRNAQTESASSFGQNFTIPAAKRKKEKGLRPFSRLLFEKRKTFFLIRFCTDAGHLIAG